LPRNPSKDDQERAAGDATKKRKPEGRGKTPRIYTAATLYQTIIATLEGLEKSLTRLKEEKEKNVNVRFGK